MKIKLQSILENPSFEERAIALYLSAFPEEERPDYHLMKEKANEGKIFLEGAIGEDGDFKGIAFCVPYKDIVYLYFLAVEPEARNHGMGSSILSAVKEAFKGRRIILNIESLHHLQNGEEELKRRRLHFYQRNGFVDFNYWSIEWDVYYDMLGCGGYVSPKEYLELMDNLFGHEMIAANFSIAL